MPVGVSRVSLGDGGTFGGSSGRLLWTLARTSLYVKSGAKKEGSGHMAQILSIFATRLRDTRYTMVIPESPHEEPSRIL